jgi:hypothetical protein
VTNQKELRRSLKWDLIYDVIWILIVYALAVSGVAGNILPQSDLPFYYSLTIIALIAMFTTYMIRRIMIKRKLE